MSLTIVNPTELHDPVPFGYSHVAAVRGELVLVGGQYGSDAAGQPVPGGFETQVDTAFAHLGTALAAVGLGYGDVARLGTYVVDHDLDKLAVVGAHLHRIWGDRPPAQTLIGVAALALPGMLFEVDAVAVRG
ncbi:RidA family protein [Pseudonocardia kunmingensis]|uniref:Enamine deaminase RidA (YjgF/YER057c/UK114 family) n=1 Tax=Pseudonocardia kunmingensis TaxID=630975 RepID=A0A543DNQ3_9PSEU|nr:Rid family hydrolase [Pseudonocardia kunmingensis]TQM10966.1 enamine deaminase RidA (YjgF/YER057c/UK114 family) [Pseudonocardia kunmingensis]